MLCILKMIGGEVTGWIIASDVHEARRLAHDADERDLAGHLYRMEFTPPPGRYELPTGHLMLVQ